MSEAKPNSQYNLAAPDSLAQRAAYRQRQAMYRRFLADCGVGVLGGSEHGAATSFGKFLKKYSGKIMVDGGRRWQFVHKKQGKGGIFVELVDCGAAGGGDGKG